MTFYRVRIVEDGWTVQKHENFPDGQWETVDTLPTEHDAQALRHELISS